MSLTEELTGLLERCFEAVYKDTSFDVTNAPLQLETIGQYHVRIEEIPDAWKNVGLWRPYRWSDIEKVILKMPENGTRSVLEGKILELYARHLSPPFRQELAERGFDFDAPFCYYEVDELLKFCKAAIAWEALVSTLKLPVLNLGFMLSCGRETLGAYAGFILVSPYTPQLYEENIKLSRLESFHITQLDDFDGIVSTIRGVYFLEKVNFSKSIKKQTLKF